MKQHDVQIQFPSIGSRSYFLLFNTLLAGFSLLPGLMASSLVAIAAEPSLSPKTTLTAQKPQNSTERVQLFVNPRLGDDSKGNGSDRNPFKTLTRALQAAQPNTTIQLATGTYSADTGEVFPIVLKPGVIVVGDPNTKGRDVVIRGGGYFISPTFAGQDIAILGANGAALAGVTVTNTHYRGYGLWIESAALVVADNTFTGSTHDGISVVGKSAPIIRNNQFIRNGANGITIYGTSTPEVLDNLFENTGFGINVAQKAEPIVRGNQILRNVDGVVVQASAKPILRNNRIEESSRDGLVAIANSQPNLGTATEPGQNQFRNNKRYDINAQVAREVIPAFGNQLTQSQIAGRVNLQGNSSLLTASGSLNLTPSRQPTPTLNSSGEISIPVPLPVNSSAALPAPPAPRNGTNSSVGGVRPPSVSDRVPNLGPLPVPSGEVPIGNAGDLDTIPVSPVPGRQLPENPPPPPSRSEVLGLRYRVVVEPVSSQDQQRVRSIVPNAFRTVINGRSVIQAGAFGRRDKAEELLQALTAKGLRAILEEY